MVLAVITYKTGLAAGSPITVLVDNTYLYYGANQSFGSLNEAITTSPTGGTGGYTYLWTIEVNGGLGGCYLSETTQAGVDVNYTDLDWVGAETNGIIRCTVTDSSGNTGYVNIGFTILRTS